jgi:hypothetical protein
VVMTSLLANLAESLIAQGELVLPTYAAEDEKVLQAMEVLDCTILRSSSSNNQSFKKLSSTNHHTKLLISVLLKNSLRRRSNSMQTTSLR